MTEPTNTNRISARPTVPLVGRMLYHGFVGAFLGLVPTFGIVVADKFASPHRADVLLAMWLIFTLAYTSFRVRHERRLQSRWPEPVLWKGFVIHIPHTIVNGGVLGAAVSMIFSGLHISEFHVAYAIVGALLVTSIYVYGYGCLLRESKAQLENNQTVITAWVSAGQDDDDRARRAEYARSKALLIGAAAAGVLEFEGAPQLTWPKPLNLNAQSFGNVESDGMAPSQGNSLRNFESTETAPVLINPATGLQMLDGNMGGTDAGGNFWGHKSDD